MYYFEKLNLGKVNDSLDFGGFLKHAIARFGLCEFADLIHLAQKFKRQLFDDYSFLIEDKSPQQADFECALRFIEVMRECWENFYVVKAKNGEIAGFWYIYDINYARKRDENFDGKEVKKPICGTIAGCLKKKFWGFEAREIMKKIYREIFSVEKFEKIKCETFSTNPYIERLLKDFEFECEGVLKNETMAAGKVCDVKIWGFHKKKLHESDEVEEN